MDFRDCPAAAEPSRSLVGYSTGKCTAIPGSAGKSKGCEVVGWCPTESDNGTTPELNVLAEVETFLIFARASIAFPRAGITTSNLYNSSPAHKKDAEASIPTLGLNLFSVRDILAETNTSFDDVAVNGAVRCRRRAPFPNSAFSQPMVPLTSVHRRRYSQSPLRGTATSTATCMSACPT